MAVSELAPGTLELYVRGVTLTADSLDHARIALEGYSEGSALQGVLLRVDARGQVDDRRAVLRGWGALFGALRDREMSRGCAAVFSDREARVAAIAAAFTVSFGFSVRPDRAAALEALGLPANG